MVFAKRPAGNEPAGRLGPKTTPVLAGSTLESLEQASLPIGCTDFFGLILHAASLHPLRSRSFFPDLPEIFIQGYKISSGPKFCDMSDIIFSGSINLILEVGDAIKAVLQAEVLS